MANPHTRDPGYRYARCGGSFEGWFVVYKASEAHPDFDIYGRGWFVESKKVGERIYTASKQAAIDIAVRAADSVGFDNWNWELTRPDAISGIWGRTRRYG